jgi:hypothetical protein
MGRTKSLKKSAETGPARLARRAGLGSVLLAAGVLLVAGCGSGKTKTVVPGSSGAGNGTAPPTTASGRYGY